MITPEKFLILAKKMVSDASIPEEEARSAVSRAYYSLYHEALELMVKKYSFGLIKEIEKQYGKPLSFQERTMLNSLDPAFLSRVNFHRVIPNVLRTMKKPIMANKFINFRDKRNQADYQFMDSMVYADAIVIVSNIDGFIGVVKGL